MTNRQSAINDLYAAHRAAGYDDVNARREIRAFIQELIELPIKQPETIPKIGDDYLTEAYPATDLELDTAEKTWVERSDNV